MSDDRNLTVIVGAASGIAEACTRLWAAEGGRDFVLLGRNSSALDAIAADLRVRDPQADITTITDDLAEAGAVDRAIAQLPRRPDTALIAFGQLPEQSALEQSTNALAASMTVNGLAPVLWAEALARAAHGHHCRIAVIGSVAGDRGRKSNYAYGAAKGMVERYVQGMQHRFAKGGPILTLIKPGPTSTAMTAHMDQSKMAPVSRVAEDIVAGIVKGKPVVYTPGKWALIMTVIRNLPRAVFNRMDI